jgi:UDP-glucose:(heptosyl)LPS alpha-1,3-glucosyltransferase
VKGMNVGFVLFDYFPFGGLQRDCLNIARACAARGHKVTLFTRTWRGERSEEIAVELLGRRGWSNVSRNRHFIGRLHQILPQHNLDGIVGFNKVPGLDLYYAADPCYLAKIARLKPRWYRFLPRYRHFASLERAVFAEDARVEILLLTGTEIPSYQIHYGTARERFHLLPPPLVKREYPEARRADLRREIRARFGWPETERVLLFVGSGFRIKGLDRVMIGLAALNKERRACTSLIVIGQNPVGRFARQAARLGVSDQVQFLGGRNDVPEFMMAADLLVHPAYSENTGTVLLEAMTGGLPVLTTDTCGYAVHVEKAEAGIVIKSPFEQEAFNQALVEMLNSSGEKWRLNGLSYAAREDFYSCHERAARIIEETMGRNRAWRTGLDPSER